MKHQNNSLLWSLIRRLAIERKGQIVTLFALALPVMVGGGALAVDMGHMFVTKSIMQNAADAGAQAGTAILAEGGTQPEAEAEAINFARQNLTFPAYLTRATPVVTFPTPESAQVSISLDIPLLLAPALGINTAAVTTNATAALAGVRSIGPGQLIPYAIYCNNAGGCAGSLAVGQIMNLRRYCGDYFEDGSVESRCGDSIADGENFLVGFTFDTSSNSNGTFRDDIRDGYPGPVTLSQQARALTGYMNGLEDGMTERLAEGRNEMIIPVIQQASNGRYTIAIADFIKVRVTGFSVSGDSVQTTFEIIRSSVSTTDFASPGEGLDINSVSGVRITG